MQVSDTPSPVPAISSRHPRKKPFYTSLWVQVLFAMVLAIGFGYFSPTKAIAMKPLGDAFIKLISMIISLIIFCTVVTGIAGMQDLKKVGRVGGKALLYFEIVSTLALLMGMVVGNVVKTGSGFNVNVATLDAKAVAEYAGQAKAQSVTDFLMHIIPTTVVDAFAKGDILEVLLVALLFGFALSAVGPRCKPLVDLFNALTHAVFGVVNILMRFAPIGAFGAMAFTVGKYGIVALGPLAKLIATFLCDLHCVRVGRAWRDCSHGGIRHNQIPALHQGRDLAGAGSQFVGAGDSDAHGEARKARLLEVPGRTRGSDGLRLQHRRNQHLYDDGCAFRSPSYEHALNPPATNDDLLSRDSDLEGSERSAGCVIYRARRDVIRCSRHSGRRHGSDSGHRPLHEHVPGPGQHDRKRRSHAGFVALGKRS
jgi:hypothetical protein